jgi:MFS superfamily sulfate permease-like transporter
MIAGCVLSYFVQLKTNFNVYIVGDIPGSFPSPIWPRWELIPQLINDAAGIALVVYVVTVSLGKMFAKMHHYKIDPNQVSVCVCVL